MVNINKASQTELQQIKGVGPVKARAIELYRTENKFKDKYELSLVKGFGSVTLEKIVHQIEV